ncbi:MAG: serine hydrolase [Ramlibacter sp.]|nr:serine hydrolase [Ramlibacter sp.]
MQAHPSRVTFSRLTRTLASGLASAAAFGWMLLAPAAQAQDALAARVDKVFAAWDKPDSPGASVAVVRDGRVIYSRGYGQAQLEYAVPNTPATTFHAASVSKQFTAFAIQLLVQEGQALAGRRGAQARARTAAAGSAVTIRQLVHHTSGVRDQWSLVLLAGLRMDDVITEPDILGLLWAQRQTNFVPGDEELYSNSGYTLLGLIVRRVSGQSLAAFAKARIFDPLGMSSTRFQENYGDLVKGRAYSYYRFRDAWRYSALSYSTPAPPASSPRWKTSPAGTTTSPPAAWVAPPCRRPCWCAASSTTAARSATPAAWCWAATAACPCRSTRARTRDSARTCCACPRKKLSVLLLGNAADLATGQLARQVADIYLEGTPAWSPCARAAARGGAAGPRPGALPGRFRDAPRLCAHLHRRAQPADGAGHRPAPLCDAGRCGRPLCGAQLRSQRHLPPPGGQPACRDGHVAAGRARPAPQARGAAGAHRRIAAGLRGRLLQPRAAHAVRPGRAQWQALCALPAWRAGTAALAGDQFSAPFPLGVLAMRRNAAGACEGFAVTTGRVRNLLFQRVRLVTGP